MQKRDAKKEVYKHEFIGKHIIVTASSQKEWVGKQCVIVDETKNTFAVLYNNTLKKVFKKGLTFVIQGTQQVIYGDLLQRRPEDRIKV